MKCEGEGERKGGACVRDEQGGRASQVGVELEADGRDLELLPKVAKQLVGGDAAHLVEGGSGGGGDGGGAQELREDLEQPAS